MQISAYSTQPAHRPHGFATVDERSRRDEPAGTVAGLAAHLNEFSHAIRTAGDLEGSQALLRHIRDTQRWYSFTIDESDPDQLAALSRWAEQSNAILVADGAPLDAHGRPLLGGAHGRPMGQVPVSGEARERSHQVREWLAAEHGLHVAEATPPVRSSDEVVVRDAGEVGLRVIALMIASDFSASVIAGRPLEVRGMQAVFPRGFAALTPVESELLTRRDPGLATSLEPRVEAAQQLLWALSRATFGWPSAPCQVDQIRRIVLSRGEEGFLTDLVLRPVPELLDEHECLASLVAAIDDLHSQGQGVSKDVSATVAGQRLTAMNWLMNPWLAWEDADRHDRRQQASST